VYRIARVKADARLVIRAPYSTSTEVNTNELEHASRTRSKYTEDEVAQLRTLWQEGKSYSQIQSQALKNHPVGSIKAKIFKLFGTGNSRESLSSLNQSPVTDNVKRDALTLHKNGLSVEAISHQLAPSVISIYSILRAAHEPPNRDPRSRSTLFTEVEVETLTSWASREVYAQEIAAAFPHRTTRSVRYRLDRVRRELGLAMRVKYKKWSPAEDARLLDLVASRTPNVSAENFHKDIAVAIGRSSISTTRNRIYKLQRKKRLHCTTGKNQQTLDT